MAQQRPSFNDTHKQRIEAFAHINSSGHVLTVGHEQLLQQVHGLIAKLMTESRDALLKSGQPLEGGCLVAFYDNLVAAYNKFDQALAIGRLQAEAAAAAPEKKQ